MSSDIWVEVDRSMQRAQELLSHIPNGYKKAITRAFNRALMEGRTLATRSVTDNYTVKAKTVRPTFTIKKATNGSIEGELESKGPMLGLDKFKHKGGKRKPVRVMVRADGGFNEIKRGFIWNNLIMRRQGKSRLPIDRLYAPAVPIMLNNEAVHDDVMEKIGEAVIKRLDHETQRILNGQG